MLQLHSGPNHKDLSSELTKDEVFFCLSDSILSLFHSHTNQQSCHILALALNNGLNRSWSFRLTHQRIRQIWNI